MSASGWDVDYPLWALLLIGLAFIGLAVLAFVVIKSRFVLLAASPLSMAGFYTLAYTAGELRRRTDLDHAR